MMLVWITLAVLLAATSFSGWYLGAATVNRNRARKILEWVENALEGQGAVTDIHWRSPSRLELSLQLDSSIFHRARLDVNLAPRQWPIAWLLFCLRKSQEIITFEADLDLRPNFSLELRMIHGFARTSKDLNPEQGAWKIDYPPPLVLSSRATWQKEITAVMQSVMNSDQREFLHLAFRRTSPHFSATLPLSALAPEAQARWDAFVVLRSIAAGATAKAS